jgi:hypothetical protein
MAKPKITKPDTSPKVYQREKIDFDLKIRELPWTEKQQALIELGADKSSRIIFLSGPAGSSKAQPLDSDILTVNGWKKMGSISVGDEVATQDGTFTKVTGVFPQGSKEIYKITFSDGTNTECCHEHLWLTQSYLERNATGKRNGKKYKKPREGCVRTTEEISKSLKHLGRANHTIPIVAPIQFPDRELLIHPYILGILLGDGCLKTSVTFCSWDDEIVERVRSLLPDSLELVVASRERHYRIKGVTHKKNPYRDYILQQRLDVNSQHKHIPDEYLFSSVRDRLELLRGLLDSDGCVANNASNTTASVSFASTSKKLAEHVQFLVQSLGGTATLSAPRQTGYYKKTGEHQPCQPVYGLYINFNPELNPFYLKRKADKYIPKTKYIPRRYIMDVEYIGEKECQCIRVEHDSHLYVTNDCIITHNTTVAMRIGLELMQQKKVSDIIFVRAAVESADSKLGFLPGDINGKYEPYMGPFEDKLEELLPAGDVKRLKGENRLIYQPINFVRGASWTARFVCIDEAQDLTINELQTLMTRLGKFTKMIICADPKQSDLPKAKQGGFEKAAHMFNTVEAQRQGIYSVSFTKDDIMRSELCKFIVETFDNNALALQAPKPESK